LVATIDWGDGSQTTPGTVSGSAGAFTVSGTHTYATAVTETATVTLSDDAPGTATATATTTVHVVEGTLQGAVALTSTTEHVAFAGTVATLTDTNPTDLASGFTATINWGDGTTAAGTVSGANGSFTVTGGHSYADEGSDPLSVTVTRTEDSKSLTLSGSVVVGENDVLTPHSVTFGATAGQSFSGTVATFTDTDLLTGTSDLVATIDWGDGSQATTGTVTGSNGSLTVSGTHTYAAAGQDTVSVTLADDAPGTATATATSTANVVQATGGLAGNITLSTIAEHTATSAVATFTDTNPTDLASGFTATIN
jgi:hypothetical protein